MRIATVGKIVKWAYICVSEIIGIAGMPDDIRAWGAWMPQIADFLDQWIVRALLVLSGIAVFTYGKWKPVLAGLTRRPAPPELAQARDLLVERAEWIVAVEPTDHSDRRESLRFSFNLEKVYGFLEDAFVPRYDEEARAHMKKHDTAKALSDYLKQLASRITAEELDPSFHLPDTFSNEDASPQSSNTEQMS